MTIGAEEREHNALWQTGPDDTEDELSILAGRTKLVTKGQSGLAESFFAEATAEGAWGEVAYPQHSPDHPTPTQNQTFNTPMNMSYPGYQRTTQAIPPYNPSQSYNQYPPVPVPTYAYDQWPLAGQPLQPPSAPVWQSPPPSQSYDSYGRPLVPIRLDHRWNTFMQDSRLFGDGQ